MRLAIGIVGKPRAGKGTLAAAIAVLSREHGYTVSQPRFSEPLMDHLKAIHTRETPLNTLKWLSYEFPVNPFNYQIQERFKRLLARLKRKEGDENRVDPLYRPNLQALAQFLERCHKGALAEAVRKRAVADPADIVILDGVRWRSDLTMLRALPDPKLPNNLLVYIKAPFRLRLKWAREANEANRKAGDATIAEGEFRRQDNRKNEWFISELGRKADFTIVNDRDDPEKRALIAGAEQLFAQKMWPRLE